MDVDNYRDAPLVLGNCITKFEFYADMYMNI